MSTQPATLGYQWTSATAARMEEFSHKIQELGTGTGVGANYYLDTKELKVRFGDHNHGIQHLLLSVPEMAALKSYAEQDKAPENAAKNAKVLRLIGDGEDALNRARDYLREEEAKCTLKAAPRPA